MNPGVHGGRAGTARAHFRKWLGQRFSRFTVAGLVVDDAPVLLWQIYVPLALTPSALDDDASEEALAAGRPIEAWIADPLPRRESPTPKGVREPQEPYGEGAPRPARTLLVSGPAGSGKTTLVSSIAAIVARGGDGPLARRFSRWLPVPLVLRDHDLDAVDSLDALVARVFAEAKALAPELEVEHLYRYLDAGEAALMLDGLDEVGSLERRRKVARWLVGHRWVVGDAENPGCAVLVTARPSGFEGLDDELRPLGALRLHVAPFSWAQIEGFLKKWFALRPITEDERRESTAALVRRLKEEPEMSELRRLCRRPAYLTALAFVQGTRGALPHSRVVLFEQIVDAYVDVLDRHRRVLSQHLGERVPFWDHDEKRAVLAEFAWRAQSGAWPEQTEGDTEARRLRWTRAVMAREVEGIVARRTWRTLKPGDGAALAEYFLQRTGLFAEPREGEVQFGHLVFQEFLTALYVVERAGAARDKGTYLEKNLLARVGSPGWFEVARLALALDDRRTAGFGHRVVLPRFDLGSPPHAELACALALSEEVQWEPWERRVWRLLCLPSAAGPDWAPYEPLRRTLVAEEPSLVEVAVRHFADEESIASALRRMLEVAAEEGRKTSQEDDDAYVSSLVVLASEALPFDDLWSTLAIKLLQPVASGAQARALITARLPLLASPRPREHESAPRIPMFWAAACLVEEALPVTRSAAAASRLAWMAADLSGWFLGSALSAWWDDPLQADEAEALVRWRARSHREVRSAMQWALMAGLADDARQAVGGLRAARTLARRHVDEWHRLTSALGWPARLWPSDPTRWVGTGWCHDSPVECAEFKTACSFAATAAAESNVGGLLAQWLGYGATVVQELDASHRTRTPHEAERLYALFFADAWLRDARPAHTTRAGLIALRQRHLDPDAMAASLVDSADRALARAEWIELLESPASPIDCVDLALSTAWDELRLDPREVRCMFADRIASLLR